MSASGESPAAAPGAAATDGQGGELRDPETYSSSTGPTRHVAHEVGPGADFRMLSAARVSRSPLFIIALLTMATPTKCGGTTSQIRNGVFLIEGDHHPLQIRAVTERFDLRPLAEASGSMGKLTELANSLDQPTLHPLLSATTVCPTFGGTQALQNPITMRKWIYNSEKQRPEYAGHIPVEHEGTRGEGPVIAWTHRAREESKDWLGCSYTLQPRMLYTGQWLAPDWHYAQQKVIWRHYANVLKRTCSDMEIRWGTLKYNSRKIVLPHKGSTNLYLCMEYCRAAHEAAQLHQAHRPSSNCTGDECAVVKAGCNHYSYSFGEEEESCYLYPSRMIRKEDLRNDWSDESLKGVTAARRCVHPDLKGGLYMGGPNRDRLNVRETCEFVPEPPNIRVHVVCSTAASALRAWMEPLRLQMETTFRNLEGWSPLTSRSPRALPSSRAPAQAGRALATLASSPQITAFMGKALMQMSRLAPAIPLVGPVIASGLLLASQILPTALHLCLQAWNDPQNLVIHTAYSQGAREMHYFGDGTSPWEQQNKTNLLLLKPALGEEAPPADITAEMARTAMKVRRAVSEIKALTKRPVPLLRSSREALGRHGKYGVITTVDVTLGHLSRVYFYLDLAQPTTTYRTAVLMSLDPGLPLIEGRAINSPEVGAPGGIVMQCYDSLRAQNHLPGKCFDNSKSGSPRNMAIPFLNDSLVVKVLGAGQIQLSCPSKHGIFYSTGTFVARISETCTVLGDGGLVVYEPPRAERTAGARGEFSIMWESAAVSSTFDSPINPRIQREVKRILIEAITWTDIVTYVLAAFALATSMAIGGMHRGLSRLNRALQATTRRSQAELEQLMKEPKPTRPTSRPPPPAKKKVTFEPMGKDIVISQPKSHPLVPLPFWSDARPAPPRDDCMV